MTVTSVEGPVRVPAPTEERLHAAAHTRLVDHLADLGPLSLSLDQGASRLLAEVRAAGLTGRGGAAFPLARKLETVATGRDPLVIANGAEGEPASRKDAYLIERAPHLVLDGLQAAALATGARQAVAYVRGSAQPALRSALAERVGAGIDRVPVDLVTAAESFISGQESAVVQAVEGRRPVPRDAPDLVVRRGVRGRPTLVSNVETLAHLALVARRDGAWFREVGTDEQPGTFLATVSGAVVRPGVHEASYGVPIGDLLARAGGSTEPVRAVLVGGYHGVWLPPSALSAPMSRAGLAPWGASPGAGVVLVLGTSESGLATAARIAAYLADQGARQCGPCLNGLPAIAQVLSRLARGEADAEAARQVEWLTRVVEGRGACHHPDGTARMVRSALRVFR